MCASTTTAHAEKCTRLISCATLPDSTWSDNARAWWTHTLSYLFSIGSTNPLCHCARLHTIQSHSHANINKTDTLKKLPCSILPNIHLYCKCNALKSTSIRPDYAYFRQIMRLTFSFPFQIRKMQKRPTCRGNWKC